MTYKCAQWLPDTEPDARRTEGSAEWIVKLLKQVHHNYYIISSFIIALCVSLQITLPADTSLTENNIASVEVSVSDSAVSVMSASNKQMDILIFFKRNKENGGSRQCP